MNRILRITVLAALLGSTAAVQAQVVTAVPAPQAAPPPEEDSVFTTPPPPAPVMMDVPAPVITAEALPPMQFYASVVSDPLFGVIKQHPAFARTDKEMAGSPIQLRITHSLQPTAGGMATGLLSAIWAGSTLGLLPVVTNNSLVLAYEVRVNGKEITRYTFERSFTRAQNIWNIDANDPTGGLGQDGLDWAKETAKQFLGEVVKDPKVQALKTEYEIYFTGGA